ncbi:GDP-mannose 4,6-dehydratase [Candidatus Pelagibacter sp. HIMB1593]|uniref:GDP-mannose 4,6-dehydratase n=1 Tax=Candidatus Pelagibacter sp. HIMB1593 TaxID=3413355 RepID=UPI003F8458DE
MSKINKILITGGFGLVGTALVNFFLKKKFKVVVFSKKKLIIRKNFFIKSKNLIFENGNLINKTRLKKVFNKHDFSGIFHLGSQTQVLKALKKPHNTFKANLIGTLNLLEIHRKKNNKVPFIYSSTDRVYGDLKKKYYTENDNLNAIYPYDCSKATSDMICQSFSKTFNSKIAIIRSCNIFGECDFNLNRIVPETIISILKDKKLKIRSNGMQKRDYVYVGDICKAYYKIFINLKNSKNDLLIYNASSNYNLTTLQLVKKIYKLMALKENYMIENNSKVEIKNQRLNFNKIKSEINWKPNTSLEQGLRYTINWYKKNIQLFKNF